MFDHTSGSRSSLFAQSHPVCNSGHSWISKVLCSSREKGFVGEGVVRWRERPSNAAHWASKASSWGCGGGCMAGEDGASWGWAAQLAAPLTATLPLDAGAAAEDGGGLTKGPMLLAAGTTCWGVVDVGTGKGWGGVAEPNTFATICEGVIPTTGTLA